MGANDTQGGAIFDPKGIMGRITKETTSHCYTQNIKALGFVDSEKNIFYVFALVSLWALMTPRVGPFLTPRA